VVLNINLLPTKKIISFFLMAELGEGHIHQQEEKLTAKTTWGKG